MLLPAASPAQSTKAGVVTTVKGTATVARASAPEPAALKFRDDVFVQDRISTGDESIARILLGGKAVVTVRERSQLTITETATTSTIEMTSGKIALSVDKSRVKPGESVEIKTPNAVAAIRGTIIIAEVDPAAAGAETRFTLLTGIVDVTRLDKGTGRLTGAPVTMQPMQTLGIVGAGALGTPRAITKTDAGSIAASFSVPLREPASSVNTKLLDDQVQEAARRASVGTSNGTKDLKDAKDAKDTSDVSSKDTSSSSGSTTTGSSTTTSGGRIVAGGGGSTSGGLVGGTLSGSGGSTGGGLVGGTLSGGAGSGAGNGDKVRIGNGYGINGGGGGIIGGDKLRLKERLR
jgi:hypothetical protein